MKKFYILLALLAAVNAYSQSHTAYDGSTFTVGDSIKIGIASGNIGSYLYIHNSSLRRISYNQYKQKYLIKRIHPNSSRHGFAGSPTVIEVGTRGLLGITYHISIDNAIRNGEVILKEYPNKILSNPISPQQTFAYNVNTTKSDSYEEEYLIRFHNDEYKKKRNNEFEFNSLLRRSREEVNKIYSETDYSQTFTTFMEVELGDYDFNEQAFFLEIRELAPRLLPLILQMGQKDLNAIAVYFTNYDEFKKLSINEEEAHSFIKRRTSERGAINRKVYIRIEYKLTEEEFDVKYLNTDKTEFFSAKIKRIAFFDHKSGEYNWLGTTH